MPALLSLHQSVIYSQIDVTEDCLSHAVMNVTNLLVTFELAFLLVKFNPALNDWLIH